MAVVAGVEVHQVSVTSGGELIVGGRERSACDSYDGVGAARGQGGSFAVGLGAGAGGEVIDRGEYFHAKWGGQGDGECDGSVVVLANVHTPACPLRSVARFVVRWECPAVRGDYPFDLGGGACECDCNQAGLVCGFGDAGDGSYLRIREASQSHLFSYQRQRYEPSGDAQFLACGSIIETQLPGHPADTGVAFPLLPAVAFIELSEECEPAKLCCCKVGRPGAQLGLQPFEWQLRRVFFMGCRRR